MNDIERMNELVLKIFEHNEDGKDLLKLLVKSYVMDPTKSLETNMLAFRSGQNDVILRLIRIIETMKIKMAEDIKKLNEENKHD